MRFSAWPRSQYSTSYSPFGAAARDVGHDVADVQSVAACLDTRAHAPLAFPGFGAIAGLGVAPHQRCLALGVAHPHIVCGLLDLPIQHLVAAETKDIINAVGLTPRHGLLASVMTVAAKGQLRVRPVRSDAAHDAPNMAANLAAGRGFAGPQQHGDGTRSGGVIDMDGQE